MEISFLVSQKIISLNDIEKYVFRLRFLSKRIVFTNGVFDVLHPGHVDYLSKALEFGDILIVGLNSDDSVRSLGKADNRPINNEMSRAIVLAGLHCVAGVIIFNGTNPFQLIKKIIPDVIVKGGDYDANEINESSKKYIVGSDLVKQSGGSVEVIPFLEGFSTTSIISKILN
jgi:D-glycero-beta-D-manno-heptose 1-phosphate adenylyltransferase